MFYLIYFIQVIAVSSYPVKNAVISSNFLEWKFCGKAQFLHSFGETAPFHKIPTPTN